MNYSICKSLIIPIYKNEENIPQLISALEKLNAAVGPGFELVFVVDGSPDNSYLMLCDRLPKVAFPSQLLSHSRNFGSFAAVRTGMAHARGDLLAVMAADLQELPDLVIHFFKILIENRADIVFGQRKKRHDAFFSKLFSNLFWTLYRKFVYKEVPPGGVDVFACNRKVKEAVLAISEPNSSLIIQLFWVGFRRSFVPYERQKREYGISAWSFARRLRYMADSLFSFSDLPIILVLSIGIFGLFFCTIIGLIILVAKFSGMIEVPGYTATILTLLLFGFFMLLTQGILGSYLWRTFENTKKRPLSLIMDKQEFTGVSSDD